MTQRSESAKKNNTNINKRVYQTQHDTTTAPYFFLQSCLTRTPKLIKTSIGILPDAHVTI